MNYASSLSSSNRRAFSVALISRSSASISRRCLSLRRYAFASSCQKVRNHTQARQDAATLAHATTGSVDLSGNILTATAVAASPALNKDRFLMKAAHHTRSFRRYRNTALSAIILSFLNGTLITPAIAAIDVLVVLVTVVCLLLALLELSRKRRQEGQS